MEIKLTISGKSIFGKFKGLLSPASQCTKPNEKTRETYTIVYEDFSGNVRYASLESFSGVVLEN